MAGLRIRAGEAADIDAVLELERGSAGAPHWAREEYVRMIDVTSSSSVRRVLLIASMNSELAGFAVGAVAGSGPEATGEIESVAVTDGCRRQGVGRALCKSIVQWCTDLGASAMELEVRASSEGARLLYSGLGFAEVGRRRNYYREPLEDAVLMRLDVRTRERNGGKNSG